MTNNFDSKRRPVRTTERVAGPYPYYGASGVIDHVEDFILDGDFLLIAEDGENLRSRSTPIAFLASGKVWVNNHAHVVEGNERADTRFLCHLLSVTDIGGYLTGSTQPKLTRSAMDSMAITIPALGTQIAIAEVLGALDEKIAANAKLASSIIQLLELETRTRWLATGSPATTAMSDIFELNPSTPRPSEAEPPYVDMKKLPESGSGIASWEHREAKGGARFSNGDTLLARITPCLQNRKTGYVDFLNDKQVGIGSTEFIVLRSRVGVPQPLSYFVAVDSDFRDFAIRHMFGTSGRQRVSANDLAGYLLPSPDSDWLADFGERATGAFELMKSLLEENRTLAATRDALLPQLMSGKLRVRDAEKVLEGVL
ncbi:restriction endonuclease subunit S [Cryobacterium sp. 1639]|uniref:restriction endonuclease subunit S n=1 Tax=Cryobacterium inferilacus TaxID=2866629 RepID=UPI001C733917|nr:restriction endonuclease subunit S [Cryobacterium sp. 1639]MBX0301636.1 restriction endonuclease subunit S [Cryobacterium sp. 1639]